MEWTTLLHFGHFADRSPKRTAWPTLIGLVEEKDFKLILAVATSPKYRNIEPAAATTKVRWTAQKIWQKYNKTMPRFISPGIITIWPSDHLTIIAEESKQQSSIGQRTKKCTQINVRILEFQREQSEERWRVRFEIPGTTKSRWE